MKISKDSILLESKDDRQNFWDAMWHYGKYCYSMSKSEHFAKDVFDEMYKDVQENIMIPMYENWDDILH